MLKNTKSHQHIVSAGPTCTRAELLLDVAGLSACANLSVRLRIVSLDKWKWQALSWLLYVSCGLLSCLKMISALLPHSTMLWVMFPFFFVCVYVSFGATGQQQVPVIVTMEMWVLSSELAGGVGWEVNSLWTGLILSYLPDFSLSSIHLYSYYQKIMSVINYAVYKGTATTSVYSLKNRGRRPELLSTYHLQVSLCSDVHASRRLLCLLVRAVL